VHGWLEKRVVSKSGTAPTLVQATTDA